MGHVLAGVQNQETSDGKRSRPHRKLLKKRGPEQGSPAPTPKGHRLAGAFW